MFKTIQTSSTGRKQHISTGRKQQLSDPPEIWGGLECTINRVGDNFRDQFEYAGHYNRPDDLEKVAGLGIKKIRYPVLWEKHVTRKGDPIDWSWAEHQLRKIISLGMEPIVGLVHHGSGPSYTDLLDPAFPSELAAFARQVVERFPFVKYFTPVNEPLTTARFSGLYGWWFPHKKDQRSFARMLLNQSKATVEAMRAIREVNPDAQLVQTEDLGKTYSTSMLKYQADFENERRWFSLDLLCGKITRRRKAWGYFNRLGITDEELQYFLDNVTVPDIFGFNYYITSERFLDHNLDKYPASLVGGNGKHRYADVEAVRVSTRKRQGVKHLLEEAWERYHHPMALTEVHIGCTREEQMRWLKYVWEICCQLRQNGIDLLAVTPWSLLGAYDWNSLLTISRMHYEPGVFDVSSGELRATAMAPMIRGLALDGRYDHPLLGQDGWWQRDIRYIHRKNSSGTCHLFSPAPMRPLLVIGKNGSLAKAFDHICQVRGITTVFMSRKDMDILDPACIEETIRKLDPWAVVNCAGFVDVDRAEHERSECMKINAEAPGLLAEACNRRELPFMTFSSDLVFNGDKKNPYTETDHVQPLSIYGESKALAEENVLGLHPGALVIRSSAFFGPWDRYNFVYSVLRSIEKSAVLELPGDVIVSPTYLPDLVHASLDLLIDRAKGIWHLANEGYISWADFAQEVAKQADAGKFRLVRRKMEEMSWIAARPLYSVLETEKGPRLPKLDNALERYFREAVAG